jgi:hypothetical protein
MSFLCIIGRHKPSIVSIARGKNGEYVALCDACGVPLARSTDNRWHASKPSGAQPSHRE